MILDCNRYRVNLPHIKRLLDLKPANERFKFIPILAASLEIPIIVMHYYVMELYGETPESLEALEILRKFYVIEDVLNCSPLSNK